MVNLSKNSLIVAIVIIVLVILFLYYFTGKFNTPNKGQSKNSNQNHKKINNANKDKNNKNNKNNNSSDSDSSDSEDNNNKDDIDFKYRDKIKQLDEKFKVKTSTFNDPKADNLTPDMPIKPLLEAISQIAKPYNLVPQLVDSSTIKLTWIGPNVDPTLPNQPPIEYAVYRYTIEPENHESNKEETKPTAIELAFTNEFTFNNLNSNEEPTQYFRVRAANPTSISDFSELIRVDLSCGLAIIDEESMLHVKESINPVYDRETGILVWNRSTGVQGYGIFVICEGYHQQFYLRERNGKQVKDAKGMLVGENKTVQEDPVKAMDLNKITDRTLIKGVIMFIVNHCNDTYSLGFA